MARLKVKKEKMVVIPKRYVLTLTDDECRDLIDTIHSLAGSAQLNEGTREILTILGGRNNGGYNV